MPHISDNNGEGGTALCNSDTSQQITTATQQVQKKYIIMDSYHFFMPSDNFWPQRKDINYKRDIINLFTSSRKNIDEPTTNNRLCTSAPVQRGYEDHVVPLLELVVQLAQQLPVRVVHEDEDAGPHLQPITAQYHCPINQSQLSIYHDSRAAPCSP